MRRNATFPAAPATVAIALALTLAACGSSSNRGASTSTERTATSTSSAAAHALAVTVAWPSTQPVAGGLWPITVRARTALGAPASGTVSYAFVFGSAIVARRPGGHMSAGVFHDRLEFPARAVGIPLTVRAVVRSANGESGSAERAVTVRR